MPKLDTPEAIEQAIVLRKLRRAVNCDGKPKVPGIYCDSCGAPIHKDPTGLPSVNNFCVACQQLKDVGRPE